VTGAVADHPEGASVRVWVVPGANATEVAGLHGGALRVRLAAPPVQGRPTRRCWISSPAGSACDRATCAWRPASAAATSWW